MLIIGLCKAVLKSFHHLLVVIILLCSLQARTQDAVSYLKADIVTENHPDAHTAARVESSFNFSRNLILFNARMNGHPGTYILDTGAPTLLINNRGNQSGTHPAPTGIAAGGSVSLANQRVESFEVSGFNLGKHWALALDLRAMEKRTGETIDGFVGQDLLRGRELRIDYPARKFQLLKSERSPRYNGQLPGTTLKFDYLDHLPVITLRIGKQKLRFAIDTGAGTNILDQRYAALARPTGEKMNIQGLDGDNIDCDIVALTGFTNLPAAATLPTTFVTMDLSHLQNEGQPEIAGIIGSAYLQNFVVGIDYRRRKLYIW